MKTDDFNFELPEQLIAQYPTNERGASRLFVLDREERRYIHAKVSDISHFIEPGTLMVFNDSRVRKARLFGTAIGTGAHVEFLLLLPMPEAGKKAGPGAGEPWTAVAEGADPQRGSSVWQCMCTKAKKQRIGRQYSFPGGLEGTITGEMGDEKIIEFSQPVGDSFLDAHGHMPLPPYIRRSDGVLDETRYQTVYARKTGSTACPTAGLHFTDEILDSLKAAGIEQRWVTLHVGLGTFLPVRTERVEDHVMHEEWYEIPPQTAEAVNTARRECRKVLAVGTTSLRTLESAWNGENGVSAGNSSTAIFIYPGYRFKVVDRLFTNFHTPKSTLLMLVSAFAGRELIMDAYSEAVREEYRFFSYGDSMLIR